MPMTSKFICPRCGNDSTTTAGNCSRCGCLYNDIWTHKTNTDPPVYTFSVDFTRCDHYARCGGYEADMWHYIAVEFAKKILTLQGGALDYAVFMAQVNTLLGQAMIDWYNRKKKVPK